jgi:hypothetical protein
MEPDSLSLLLRRLASSVEGGMSRRAVASAVASLLFATDKSLALSVREALHGEIDKLLPGKFALYDTNAEGKGWRPGYVSFGLGPSQWKDEGIVGGILVGAEYDPSSFRSESTGKPDDKFQHSQGGGIIELQVTGCYYNKLLGGGCDPETAVGVVGLGGVHVYVDAKESVFQIDIVDPGAMKTGLDSIIKDISSNPPDHAKSEKRKKGEQSPTGSPQSLLKWLGLQQRSDVGKSEIEALARAQSQKTGKGFGNAVADITKFFRDRGWSMNPSA